MKSQNTVLTSIYKYVIIYAFINNTDADDIKRNPSQVCWRKLAASLPSSFRQITPALSYTIQSKYNPGDVISELTFYLFIDDVVLPARSDALAHYLFGSALSHWAFLRNCRSMTVKGSFRMRSEGEIEGERGSAFVSFSMAPSVRV